MLQAIDSVKSCMASNKYGVLGLHLEGPYINESKAGAHDKKIIRSISFDELELLAKKGKDVIKIFTVAPETIKEEHVKFLKDYNIIISAGHTKATYEDAMKSFDWGISMVTHIFNAMSQFESREPGVVGAALDSNSIWAGIIVDGFHVHFGSVRICKKIKGKRLILVTDAMPPVGSNLTEFRVGDLKVLCKNGRCATEEGTLAGSALDMATAVRNCVQKVGIPMDEALRMASSYPAECLGVSNFLGKIKPGYLANMVIFDNQLEVKAIISDGKYESILD
jgi:N-acetylglucosamine-6-phosphate deacetylase